MKLSKMKLSVIWALLKPVVIIALAVAGYFFANNFFARNVFLTIAILSFMFRGGAIVQGIKTIYLALKKE